MKTIRLLLVDDEAAIRRGLRMRLAIEPDVEVVGEAVDASSAVEMSRQLAPHVVVMDVELPGQDGIAATIALQQLAPAPAVVMLSMHDDASTVARALAAGAVGFVAKQHADGALLKAIRRAAHGEEGSDA
jgi:DNA-binding NarL/FixJ family response regulator